MVYFFRAGVIFCLFYPFWPILAYKLEIYVLHGVLFTGLSNVAVYQNWQTWGVTMGCIFSLLVPLCSWARPCWLGTEAVTKTDVFWEKFQRAFDPPPPFILGKSSCKFLHCLFLLCNLFQHHLADAAHRIKTAEVAFDKEMHTKSRISVWLFLFNFNLPQQTNSLSAIFLISCSKSPVYRSKISNINLWIQNDQNDTSWSEELEKCKEQ